MTHEQKPESTEFRTREAQISDLAFEISDWKSYDDNEDIPLARAHIAEAEARGAAEQRRKDTEASAHDTKEFVEAMDELLKAASDLLEDAYRETALPATEAEHLQEIRFLEQEHFGKAFAAIEKAKKRLTATDEQKREIILAKLTRPANVAALEDRVKELEREICSIRERVKGAASSVMGIRTDAMNGDNLAITLASYFEDLLGERGLNGWPPEAQKACDEIEAAIVAHMAAAIRKGGER